MTIDSQDSTENIGQEAEPPSLEDSSTLGDDGVVRAASILAIGNVASRLMGLIREIVKASLFGASGLLAAYEVAVYVPMSLYELFVGGMVNSALVPVFSDYTAPEKRADLWHLVSAFLSVMTVFLLLVIALVELFAPAVAWLIGARNFEDPALTAISIQLMRMAIPAILFLSISSVLTAVLFALKRFTLPAFTGAVFNGTIALVAILRPEAISSLVWGLLLGSIMQIALQMPALRDAHLRWLWAPRHPAMRRILRLYTPIVAGLIINQLAVALSYNLATRTGDASLTYMRFATTLYQFPLGLVVTALSVATLPTLSRQASGRLAEFKRTLAEGTRLVIALILPATAGLFALALPIVALLFEYGRFTPQDSEITASVLRIYLFGLPFAAVDQMLIFGSYARKDTLRPALVGVFSIIIYLIVAVALLQPLGLLSLMVADAVKHVVHVTCMVLILRVQLGGLSGYHVGRTLLKSLVAALVTGITAYGVAWLVFQNVTLSTFTGKLSVVLFAGLGGVAAYTLMVLLLDIQEAKTLRYVFKR